MPSGKISTGPNARARDESIAQTATGLPNDSSRAVEIDDEEVRRVERKLKGEPAANRENSK